MNGRIRAITILIAVFLVGCLCGAGSLNFWAKNHGWAQSNMNGPRRGGSPNSIFDQLQLTPDQQAKLKVILDESRGQIDAIRNGMRPQFDAVRDQTNLKISGILNEEQKKKFEQSIREAEQHRGAAHGRGGFGPRMPPSEGK
jgi:hypothetical protein